MIEWLAVAALATAADAARPEPLVEAARRHAAAAAQDPAPPDETPKVRHGDEGTTLTLSNAEISLINRLQFRFVDEMPPDSVQLPGTTAGGQAKPSFRIRRAKTSLEGWFWKEELTFELQLSWAGPEAGASTETPLEDAVLNWDASKKGAFVITIGQMKVPLGRQEMTSSGKQQFVERSLLNLEFTRGRDVGIQFSGRLAKDKLSYYAGIFNGNAASRPSNDNTKLQYNARVSFEPKGKVAFSESAFEGWDAPLFAIAGSFEHNDLSGATNLTDLKTTILGADVVFKSKGFSLFAEYYDRKRTPESVSGSSTTSGGGAVGASGSYKSNGYNVQAGYFLKRDTLEVAARVAGWDPTNQTSSNDITERGGSINYFIRKHALKIQADFRALRDEARRATTKELRVQTQFMF